MQQVMKIVMDNMPFIVIGMAIGWLILLGLVVNQAMKLNYMKKRYRKMMAGVDGANLERMLMGHIDDNKRHVVHHNLHNLLHIHSFCLLLFSGCFT